MTATHDHLAPQYPHDNTEPIITQPAPRQERRALKGVNRWMAAGLAATATTAVAFGLTHMGGKEYVEGNDGMLYDEKTASAPLVPGETQSPRSVDALRIQDINRGEVLLAGVHDQSLAELNAKGYNLQPGVPADNNTDKEIADQYAVNMYGVWLLSKNSNSEATTALKAVINPDGASDDDFKRMTELFNYPGGIEAVTKNVLDWTKTFYNSDYKDVPANGDAMRVLTVQYNDDTANQITFQREGEDNPWIVQKMVPVDPAEPDFVSDLREIDKIVS